MTSRNIKRIRANGKEFLKDGLNVTDNPLLVPFSEMSEARNLLVGSTPARKPRPGQSYFNTDGEDANATYPLNPKNNGGSDGDPILGLYEFWRYVAGVPTSTVLVRQGTKIWAIDGRTGAATDITGGLTLPTTGKITFQSFEGRVYWASTNTAEGYNVWTGIGNATASTPPADGTPRYLVSHNGRMFAFGVPGFPYRLYYSEFYDAETFATVALGTTGAAAEAGSLDLDPFGDPKGIVGGVSFQNSFYAFMGRSIFRITGFTINDFAVESFNSHIGCVGHHTIVPVENDVIYASERGILTLSSTDKAVKSEVAFASRPISRLWNKSLNRTIEDQYHATLDNDENLYLLSCASKGSTGNDTILAYNIQSGAWTTWDGHKARTITTFVDTDGIRRPMFGREDGILSISDPTIRNDLGSPYLSKFRTGILFPSGGMDIEHVFQDFTILASTVGSSQITVNAYVDSKLAATEAFDIQSGEDVLGSSFVLGQSALGNGVFVPQTYRIGDKGYGLQLEVIFNTEDESEVYGFVVSTVDADRRIGGAP